MHVKASRTRRACLRPIKEELADVWAMVQRRSVLLPTLYGVRTSFVLHVYVCIGLPACLPACLLGHPPINSTTDSLVRRYLARCCCCWRVRSKHHNPSKSSSCRQQQRVRCVVALTKTKWHRFNPAILASESSTSTARPAQAANRAANNALEERAAAAAAASRLPWFPQSSPSSSSSPVPPSPSAASSPAPAAPAYHRWWRDRRQPHPLKTIERARRRASFLLLKVSLAAGGAACTRHHLVARAAR